MPLAYLFSRIQRMKCCSRCIQRRRWTVAAGYSFMMPTGHFLSYDGPSSDARRRPADESIRVTPGARRSVLRWAKTGTRAFGPTKNMMRTTHV